jgi:hypothetical protein
MAGEIEAAAAAATAQLAQMKADFEASPERQLERDRAELARLENDPHHLGARLTNERAQADIAALKARIAIGEATTPVVRTDAERLGDILSGKADIPLIETTVDGQLTTHATMTAVEDLRALGLSDATIGEAINGAKYPPHYIRWAKALFEDHMSRPEWVAKLLAGDKAARKDLACMQIIMNSTPIDDAQG